MNQEGLRNYTEFLIKEAQILLAQKDYKEAVFRCLIESTDGQSGWIREIDALFRKPRTLEEAKLRTELRDVNLRAAKGLLEGISSVDSYLAAADVRAAEVCLSRLNAKIPPELLEKLEKLVAECEKIGW